ncbi:Tim44 domain-containing protein [Aquabacterium sp.]|uniref:Tim44 domain-containing protein n=1 Tax=Aquabacterium sp. TaxID=1872578 RepID=UPI003784C357
MKRLLVAALVAVLGLGLGLGPVDVEAKRLGGGTSSGIKRTTPRQQSPVQAPPQQQNPAQPNAPQQAAQSGPGAQPAAAAPRRSWMGPLAGLAAGIGLAALLSHFGLGAEVAGLLTMVLVAGLVVFVGLWLMRRFARHGHGVPAPGNRLQYAGAGAPPPAFGGWPGTPAPPAPAAPALAGFDAAGFEQIAKQLFTRLQAANDAGNLAELRRYATPEMAEQFQRELMQRGGAAQQTAVMKLDAQVVDTAEEGGQQVVSVRFHGLIVEAQDSAAQPFDEVWHFVRPADGSGAWALAGIAQTA